MTAVEAAGLVRHFGERPVLRGVDLSLEAGERLAVLGANGSGKTTLLRLLATLSRADAGRLLLLGRDAIRERAALRARIGYVGHQPGLYPALTAAENLELFCTLRSLPRGRAQESLRAVGLAAAGRTPAGELSRGTQQRVAIARSLLHEPELWVLDEPDASLDEESRALLGGLAGNRTVVIATHDRRLAHSLCHRSVRLDGGTVVERPRLRAVGR